jgi:hypothetical protein
MESILSSHGLNCRLTSVDMKGASRALLIDDGEVGGLDDGTVIPSALGVMDITGCGASSFRVYKFGLFLLSSSLTAFAFLLVFDDDGGGDGDAVCD